MNSTEEAVFGIQCFWGSEVKFGAINGVLTTSVGYTGGSTPNPTYKNLSDHTEVVRVDFEPQVISYEKLLSLFWSAHDPTDAYKRQYMSAIFYASDRQKELAQKSLNEKQKQLSKPIVTLILPLKQYYLAEDYHQKYFLRKHASLLAELNLSDSQLVKSPVATRLNAFCAGFGTEHQLADELKRFGLTLGEDNQKLIKQLIGYGPNLGEC